MVDETTRNVANFVMTHKIKVTELSRMSGVPYNRLRYCLLEHRGSLKAEEYLRVCKAIGYPIHKDILRCSTKDTISGKED